MSNEHQSAPPSESGSVAVVEKPAPSRPRLDRLPQWNVLLHNDDVNTVEYVIRTIVDLTPLNIDAAVQRTVEADRSGISLLLQTHREHAELLQEQFTSKLLTVTIEPDR